MSKVDKGKSKQQIQSLSGVLPEQKLMKRIIVFFFVMCFVLYGRSLHNRYSMDDEYVTYNNAMVHEGFKGIPKIFRSTYVVDERKSSYEYRPLVKATYAVEYQLFGENPLVSHLINILLYFLNVVLLFKLMKKILRDQNILFPFLIAVLFLVHPLHSEVVLSLKNRDVLLSFMASFLSLGFYLKYAELSKVRDLALGVFFMVIALISKKDSMTFWAITPLAIYFFTNASWRRIISIILFNFLPFFIVRLMSHGVGNHVKRVFLSFENPLFFGDSFLERIPMGLYCLWFYIKMFFVPYPLLAYYGYNEIPQPHWSDPAVLFVIALLGGIGYYLVKNRTKKNIVLFAILYFLATISMFLNVAKPVVGIVAERFEYIPSVGLCILAAYGILKFFKVRTEEKAVKFFAFNQKLYVSVAVVALVFSVEVIARNHDWKDALTTYESDVKKAPASAHLNTLYAAACVKKVRDNSSMAIELKRKYINAAIKHYKISLEIIPDYISSLNNLGMIYYSFYNKPKESIPYLKKAATLDTNYVEAYFNLASCEAAIGNYDEAETHYKHCIAVDPSFANSYFSLSALYGRKQRYQEIIDLNQRAIQKGVKSDVLYVNIGNAYFVQGDTTAALPYLEKAISINPNNPKLNSFLSDYYRRHGNLEKFNFYDRLASR